MRDDSHLWTGLRRAGRSELGGTRHPLVVKLPGLFCSKEYRTPGTPARSLQTWHRSTLPSMSLAQTQPSPLFTVKGLPNMAPSTLTTLDLFGIPLARQVAFAQYANNISSFIHASVTRKKVVVGHTPLGLLKSDISLPIDPPSVQFVLQKEVNFEQSEKFLKNLGTGATKWKTGKTTIFKTPALPTRMDEQLLGVIAPHYNCGRDAVTPPGIVAFRFLSSAIAHLLRVHTYAVYPKNDFQTTSRLLFRRTSMICLPISFESI
jgi:hypothetical protein